MSKTDTRLLWYLRRRNLSDMAAVNGGISEAIRSPVAHGICHRGKIPAKRAGCAAFDNTGYAAHEEIRNLAKTFIELNDAR